MDAGALTLSHFLRRSGEVLKRTDTEDVVLERRDGDDLLISTVARADAVRAGLDLLAEAVLEIMRDSTLSIALARAIGSSARWTSTLAPREREDLLRDVATAAAQSSSLGAAAPLMRSLERWRRTARLRATTTPVSGHLTRPVAIPDDVDDPSIRKHRGVVELPLRVRWSHPLRAYDLSDPRQLRRVYEQVLREGTEDDVRAFIDVDELLRQWDQLVLPRPVRQAWADWFHRRRGLVLAC